MKTVSQYNHSRPSSGNQRYSNQNPSRPSGNRSANGRRPNGARSANGSRPNGNRPTNSRPPQNRRPAPRKKKPQTRFYAIIAVAVVLILALILAISGVFSSNDTPTTNPTTQPTATPDAAATDSATDEPGSDEQSVSSHTALLQQQLANEGASVEGLSADEMVEVTDLSINQSLPSEWMNILLLGSDERKMSDSARTDSMIICSINTNTGEVKLTSLMRDTAVEYTDLGEYNGTWRLNAANYFGGEELAMKTVNECFSMNIQYYVRVNFYGFQQVAQMLGGITMDITEDEKNLINEMIVEQAKISYLEGLDESNIPYEYLESYGPNTQLDGRMTLAYARIRKLDSEYERTNRQRKVLSALLDKLKEKGAAEIMTLGLSCMDYFRTNLPLDQILSIAMKVVDSDMSEMESFRLPVNGSYKQETRNEQDMLYDCDWSTNASELYNFIYG